MDQLINLLSFIEMYVPDSIFTVWDELSNHSKVAFGISILTLLIFVLPRQKRKRRRNKKRHQRKSQKRSDIDRSKSWLKSFREQKAMYSDRQRFAFVRRVDHFLWEDILMTCFEERGYPVVRTPKTRDGGSDGFVTIAGEVVMIQAKRYSGSISKEHIKEFVALTYATPTVDRGLFIHSGRSSKNIKSAVNTYQNIQMISGVQEILKFLDGESIEVFGKKLSKGI